MRRTNPRGRHLVHLAVILGLLLSLLGPVPWRPLPARATAGDDEFNSAILSSQWSWLREAPGSWSLTARPGYLRLLTQPTDLSPTSATAPLLLEPLPAGDVAVTTAVTLTPTQNSQQAGLVAYGGDGDLARLDYGYVNASPVVQLTLVANGTSQTQQIPAPAGGTVVLELIRSGQDVLGYASTDGATWTRVGQFTSVAAGFSQLGLTAFNGQGSPAASIAADFDYVHLTALPTGYAGNDEFASSTLGSQWSWVREIAGDWSLTADPGFLQITTTNTDLYDTTNSAPVLLQAAPSGDLAITTRVTLSPTQNYQQAGLILYADDDNYVRLEYGSVGGLSVEFGHEIAASWTSTVTPAPAGSTFYLRLSRVGQTYTGFYSTDGSSWTQVGQSTLNLTTTQMGLFAFNGQNMGDPQIPADFDFFHAQTFPVGSPASGGGTPAAGGPSYVYDDLGRLEAVTDPASDTAIYHDDAAGNVTSITRQSSSTLALIDFSPQHGPAGGSVTLSGTAFSPTASDDTVQFNGTAATVTSATATQLVVSVPSGATSGPLSVTVGTNTVTSSASYTVTANPVPTIASFSPTIASPGTDLTVSGSNFDPTVANDRFSLNASLVLPSSVSAGSLSATIPSSATSGHLTVETPDGSGTSSGYLYVPPPGYSPSQIGVTSQLALGGSQTVTLSTAGQDGMVLFDGTRGQRTYLNLTGCSFANVTVTLYNPDGSQLSSTDIGTNGGYIDTQTLPATGTYDIFIQPNASATGSVTLTLDNVTPDATAPITAGGPAVTVTTTTPGQNAQLTFTETAGHAISLNITDATFTGYEGIFYVTIYNPDGSVLVNQDAGGNGALYIDKTAVSQTGTYTILVDPYQAGTGSATLQLYDVPPDVTAPITTDGTAVTVTTTTPGQNAQLTFTETAGHAISLVISTVTFSDYENIFYLTITNPDGTTLLNRVPGGQGYLYIDKTAVSQTGTYTILVDVNAAGTGSATLQLYDVPPDATAPITIGGTAVTVTTTVPGQNAQLTFSASSGGQVTTSVTNATFTDRYGIFYLSIVNPDGTTLVNRAEGYQGSLTVGPTSLAQTGTYTILIDVDQAGTGSATVTLTGSSGQVAPMGPAVARAHTARPGGNPPLWMASEEPAGPAAGSTPSTPAGTPAAGDSGSSGGSAGDEWVPGPNNDTGNWLSGLPPSPWQHQLPLQATPGVTALAGQVLLVGGRPLAGVTLRLGGKATLTDATGRFLLTGIPDGHQVLTIDGASASHPGHVYGRFDAGVEILPGQTTFLGYTIWLERLDEAHVTGFSSPATPDVVLTTPRIPGLEVHLPAGSVITDPGGQVVTTMGITAIPVDRPPFPLPPNTQVPVYFTVQPGGSTIVPKGAYIVYPNYAHAAPGTRVDFWHYDPLDEGWFIYGEGTVTPDGTQVMPDPGTRLYEFSGAMISSAGNPPSTYPRPGNLEQSGDPVDLGTGLFVLSHTDLALPGLPALAITRTYRPGDSTSREFGIGTSFNYGLYLYATQNYQQADLILPDGGRVPYVRISAGTGYTDAVYEDTATPTAFYGSLLAWNGSGWNLTLTDGTVYVFGENAPLQAIRDRSGNQVTLTRTGGQSGTITRISASDGRWIALSYDPSNRITSATDNTGRTVSYSYDSAGRLATVTDPNRGVTTYGYDASNELTTIQDARGITYLTTQYDANGRVTQQTQADSSTYQFSYTLDANGNVTQTTVTDPRGMVRQVAFNGDGYATSDTLGVGTPQAQTTTATRAAGSDLVTAVTDALGRETTYTYDAQGNVTAVTRLAGTPNAVTTSLTYTPRYSELASVTDPLNHTTTFGYDAQGNLTSLTDPLGHTTTLTYTAAGQPATVTDPLNRTTSFGYDQGDLVAVTDPLGRGSTRFVDAAGRVLASTDPLGHVTRATYDALNQLLTVTDPLGGVTAYAYDPNGNLTSLTDPLNHTTSYGYDAMDRLVSMTDPLTRVTSYGYDANGNLTSVTDPKQQTTTATYDPLDRPAVVTFADGSTDTDTYDAGNRLTQVVDSVSGTISAGYDGLDRLTGETTPQGSVSYTYDAAGRRTAMTVAGQPGVSYAWDAANRLTQLTQGSATVSVGYDSADRRTSLTLPNGVVVAYGYDSASQLTSLTYTSGQTQLGDLSYGYDLAGRVTTVGGSWARTGLPAAVSTATYDAANQLTQWGTASLSYDANGNLTGDGTNTYRWDARNQLVGIAGGTTASFGYDAVGRRTSTTLNGTSTSYLYDGATLVQELTGGTPTVNYLTGLAVDETFSRTDASGTSSYLTDRLGSTLALTDGTGAVQTSYTYDPFGTPSVSGASSPNTLQYTGLPNDGTGLQYNRARYYDPSLQRFISPDPAGFGGGSLNLYSYVGDSPTNGTDPSGQFVEFAAACAIGAAASVALDWAGQSLAGRKYTAGQGARDAGLGCLLGMLDPGLLVGEGGALAAGEEAGGALTADAAKAAAGSSDVSAGTKLYRVWGDEARAWGRSWTTEDPSLAGNYRDIAGLPNQNSGRFVSEGMLTNTEGVEVTTAAPLHGNQGGMTEVIVPNPEQQIELQRVSGVNPPF